MQHAAQQIALQEYLHAVTEATTRIGRLAAERIIGRGGSRRWDSMRG
jgi:hypothetical protein